MKCVIVYFSLTGNTEKIAKAIQKGIQTAGATCDIIPIKQAHPKRLYDYDLIGMGSMVFSGTPVNVTKFIKDMRYLGGKHCFSFCTHCTLGFTHNPFVVNKMHEKGMIPIGWASWYGHSWGPIHQPTPYPTDGHPDEIDLEEAEKFGREILWLSQKIYAGQTDLIPDLPEIIPFPIHAEAGLHPYPFPKVVKFHKEKCTYPHCRLCMEVCPMDGIDLSVDPPILCKPCLKCQFCEQVCPTGAIDADLEIQGKMCEIISESLQKTGLPHLLEDEAKGKFRWCIPKEQVDWHTPVFKAYPQHPRFIIGKGRP